MAKREKNRRTATANSPSISEITVSGFKSIRDEVRIEIRPLTILAGANSSGKSSVMQPLLLLKQTLDLSYDPACLLLNGPNVKFTTAEQLLSRDKRHSSDQFSVGLQLATDKSLETTFRKKDKFGFRIEHMTIDDMKLWPGMSESELKDSGVTQLYRAPSPEDLSEQFKNTPGRWEIGQRRCFLELQWVLSSPNPTRTHTSPQDNLAKLWTEEIPRVIHLPGLRGNPERTSPVAAVGPNYPGTFEKYAASLISQWTEEGESCLADLNNDMQRLRLTGGVTAVRPNDAQIEVYVGRTPDVKPTSPENRVSVADVGIGVSQCLPVVVALHAALPGQLVYIEQPETHLHPARQVALAQIFATAANRGVRVVVETHSSLLLLGVQALVAKGELAVNTVKLHWFQRDPDGHSVVTSQDLDEAGRFGAWPEDFDDVTLQAQKDFLDAAEKHLFAK